MSLPIAWVEKIFMKLTLIYGRDFVGRWEGLNMADVKTDWGHELAGFEAHPEAIAYALQNMPVGKPPTVLEFRSIARKAPMPEHKQLTAPAVSPQRLTEELAKLATMRQHRQAVGSKDWAHRIIARHEKGEKVRALSLRWAREALGAEA